MATTHRSDLIDELEKALRDEAYDGGMGALGPETFTDYVRGLAVTAAKVVEEAHTPTEDERVMSTDEPVFTLDADSLLSKWGFGDGDALSDWWWEHFEEDPPFDDRRALHALVLSYLVPAITDAGREVNVYWIETIHNPVRSDTLDGAPVDHYSARLWTIDPPIVVQVTRAQIEALASTAVVVGQKGESHG
ncbi:hypothetical protein [Microbacterium sp. NPDC055599]